MWLGYSPSPHLHTYTVRSSMHISFQHLIINNNYSVQPSSLDQIGGCIILTIVDTTGWWHAEMSRGGTALSAFVWIPNFHIQDHMKSYLLVLTPPSPEDVLCILNIVYISHPSKTKHLQASIYNTRNIILCHYFLTCSRMCTLCSYALKFSKAIMLIVLYLHVLCSQFWY